MLNVLVSLVYTAIAECADVINLALGMHMDIKQPGKMTLIRSDCCTSASTGVTCSGAIVIIIGWNALGLDGSINGTAIPKQLQNLFLHGNALTGDLPSFPNSIQQIYLNYPGAGGNHFTGTLNLYSPLIVYANNNWITDVTIFDIGPITTSGDCDVSYNPLLNSPNLPSIAQCTQIGLYSSNLLPNTRLSSTLTKSNPVYLSTTVSKSANLLTYSLATLITAVPSIVTATTTTFTPTTTALISDTTHLLPNTGLVFSTATLKPNLFTTEISWYTSSVKVTEMNSGFELTSFSNAILVSTKYLDAAMPIFSTSTSSKGGIFILI